VIKDSGNPAMTGTSTLTVIIRDVNDNKMQPGSKEIFAYNYMVNDYFKNYITTIVVNVECFTENFLKYVLKI